MSEIYRTQSSTVVTMNNGFLLEVRRGELRGADLTDKKVWLTQAEWLETIKEPLIEASPLTPDQQIVKKLYEATAYKKAFGILCKNSSTHRAIAKLKSKIILKKNALNNFIQLAGNSSNNIRIRNSSNNIRITLPVDISQIFYPRYGNSFDSFVYVQNIPIEIEYIENDIKKHETELAKLINEYKTSPNKYYIKKSRYYPNSKYWIECDDGIIYQLYYHPKDNIIAIYDDHDIKFGKTFEELGIKVVQWWNMNGNLKRINVN